MTVWTTTLAGWASVVGWLYARALRKIDRLEARVRDRDEMARRAYVAECSARWLLRERLARASAAHDPDA